MIPGWERSPGGGHGNPLLHFLPGKSHGQKSLVGNSAWGGKELDMTDHGSESIIGGLQGSCLCQRRKGEMEKDLTADSLTPRGRGSHGLEWSPLYI